MATNKVNDASIKASIESYFRAEPDGLDVTAYVLNEIGSDDFAKYARATGDKNASPEKQVHDAKQRMGMEIKERLEAMYAEVESLGTVPVDPERWPELAWVKNYTQHRVNAARRRMS